MGVTEICPGTHYCTNDMAEVCEDAMLGVNQAYEDDVWRAGDGVLLNQQVSVPDLLVTIQSMYPWISFSQLLPC